MGLANVDEIASQLIRAGRPAKTPVAIIENGTTGSQRQFLTSLEELPKTVHRTELQSPVMFVIGQVASLAEELKGCQSICVEPPPRAQQLLV